MSRSFRRPHFSWKRGLFIGLFFAVGGFGNVVPALATGVCECACVGPGRVTAPGGSACGTDSDCSSAACQQYCSGFGPYSPGVLANGRRVYSCIDGARTNNAGSPEVRNPSDVRSTPPPPPTNEPAGNPDSGNGTTPPAAVPSGAPTRGTCSFSCQSASGERVRAMVIVPCSTNNDCAQACTNRCPVPGPMERDAQNRPTNGLAQNGSGLVCSTQPEEPRCVFPAGTDAPPGAESRSSGGTEGGLRFVLPSCTENGNCSLTDIINTGIRAANFLLALSGLVFLGTVLWAGAQLLLFAQDAKSISKAQGMIISASIAMIILMVAGVAVRLVSSSLGVTPSLLETPSRTENAPPASRTTTPPGQT